MKYAVLIMTMVATAANAGFLDDVGSVLGAVNQVLGSTESVPSVSSQPTKIFASPSDVQLQKIAALLTQPTNRPSLDNSIAQARNNISQLLVLGGCANTFNFGAGAVQSPQAFYSAITSAIASTSYHPKSQCMTVQNIGAWEQPAKNVFKFKVVYVSDVSGETVTRNIEMIDEYGNGNWLTNKHDIY